MPTDNPTWWTVLEAVPAWRPTIRVSTVDNAYEFPLAQHHDNAESLAKLAVIEGLRAYMRTYSFGRDIAEEAVGYGTDADLISAALAVAASTNPIASPPAKEGHNPAASIQKPSGSGTYGQRGAEA